MRMHYYKLQHNAKFSYLMFTEILKMNKHFCVYTFHNKHNLKKSNYQEIYEGFYFVESTAYWESQGLTAQKHHLTTENKTSIKILST